MVSGNLFDPENYNATLRELSNGQMFFGSLFFLLAIGLYLYRQIGIYWPAAIVYRYFKYVARKYLGRAPQTTDPLEAISLGQQLALAFFTFLLGATLRAGYIWSFLILRQLDSEIADQIVVNLGFLMVLSSFLMTLGSICAVRVVTPKNWRPYNWLIPTIVVAVIPTVFLYTL